MSSDPPISVEPANGADPLEGIGGTLVSEMPEPQQHAIDEATRNQTDGGVEVDALGVPWNPQEHATGADGRGVKTQRGTWRKRRGLSGSASVLNTTTSRRAPEPEPDPAVQALASHELACRKGGAMAARLLINVSVGIGGTDFMPRVIEVPGGVKISELETLEGAFGDYFVAQDIEDLPPGWALAGALAFYFLPRFTMPETKKRVGGFYQWCKAKWASFRMRKHGLKVVPKEKAGDDNAAT